MNIIRRHEILRTTFAAVDGQPVQVIAPDARVALTVTDLRAVPAGTAKTPRGVWPPQKSASRSTQPRAHSSVSAYSIWTSKSIASW